MVIDEEINLTRLLVCISQVGQKRKIKEIDSRMRLYTEKELVQYLTGHSDRNDYIHVLVYELQPWRSRLEHSHRKRKVGC